MYLKKLEVQGFKSFADKIGLDFNSGVTSVVGPNGSGKSNIADSVRWVLGEQSAKTLRGSKMEDVIFAGTEHRKPMGFAEVTLVIDNSEKALAVEYSEVSVSRRVYRSGESEYYINKTPCRLKDIHELFLDTGIGRDGYSIIGQGRVDEILSSRSEDRRNIFEEASGIMKFKVRKQEAEKKLDQTEQNLMRINDIINELSTQIEPLKQQSEVARRYLTSRETLKELEINVYIENISKLKEKINEFEEQYSSLKKDIEDEQKKLDEITAKNQNRTELIKSIEERLEASRQYFYTIEGNIEKSGSELRVNEEKIANLEKDNIRIEKEINEAEIKLKEFIDDKASKTARMEELEEKLNEFQKNLKVYENQMKELISTLNENEQQIEAMKSQIMDKLDIQSDKKTQLANASTHHENLKRRRGSISNEVYQIALEKDQEVIKREEFKESISKIEEEIKYSLGKLGELRNEKSQLEKDLERFTKHLNSVKSDIQVKLSRQKILKDLEKNLEGYSRSVKEILQACSRKPELGRGILGALAQLLKVDARYETAIEMSLGGALQNIVTNTEEDAKKAIEYLKANRLGRATFLPVSAVKGKSFDSSMRGRIRGHEGFCGVASDLVTYGENLDGIVQSLLGKVVVVENLEYGIKMAKSFGYSFRIVTLEGDILSTSGSMSGGSTDSRGPGILSRNREITELTESIEVLKKSEIELEGKNLEIVTMLKEVASEVLAEEERLKNNELIKIRDESHAAQVEENIKRCEAKIEMLKEESLQIENQEKDIDIEISKYNLEIKKIEDDIGNIKNTISHDQDKYKEGQTVRETLSNDITSCKVSISSVTETIGNLKEAIDRILYETEAISGNIGKRKNENLKNSNEIKSLKEENTGLNLIIKGFLEEKAGKTLQIDALTEEKKSMESDLVDTINATNDINRNITLLKDEFNKVEIKRARTETEMDAAKNRMWDEYELTYSNALSLKKDIGSIVAAQKKINDIKSEVRDLGPVNVASIDEYVKTKERFDFMTVQRDDMEQAKEKLHKVIAEITQIMKKQFIEQFKLINTNFNMVFKELFNGGRADLIIVDSENVLESGIEIEVQPPGKKLQNMMLLSGGERAFTAIALLFAILRLRPTPFCILDEIEAALDDANVSRFAEYIRSFADNTQFIMITHRKGTMEAADTLYGVTMQEHGVSSVVSMRMAEKVS